MRERELALGFNTSLVRLALCLGWVMALAGYGFNTSLVRLAPLGSHLISSLLSARFNTSLVRLAHIDAAELHLLHELFQYQLGSIGAPVFGRGHG